MSMRTLGPSRTTRPHALLVTLVIALVAVGLNVAPALAAPQHDKVVSAVPSASTPAVNNGEVDSIVQVGNTMVVGGSFTSVTPPGGTAVTRNNIFAFNVSTGALVNGFAPAVNGAVNDLEPGPVAGTVLVGGTFSTVNGATSSRVTLLNVTTGAVVSGFRAAAINGAVNSLSLVGNRVFVGGNFTTVGGAAHAGLASLNATTGAIDNYVSNQVSGRHNDSGSGAQGAIGVRDLDVSPAGDRLVAVGNFKRVDGLLRDQIVMLTLGGSSSSVTTDWYTKRYEPYCFNWAFDSYMRGVGFSPDGSYVVVATTGGQNAGSLCDTAARFETYAQGTELQPTWANYSGGDTLWGIVATETAVYVGGHQRWMNNSNGSDFAGTGAVPRPGVAALSTKTGLPLKWNPGRNPRGAAVYALYPTAQGLWMGSDTETLGNRYQYRRPRLAFFPLASGEEETADGTPGLPGTAYLGGRFGSSGNVLYRINAGGGAVGSIDNGPDWTGDDGSLRNSGNPAGWASGASQDETVPAGTPNAIFDTEVWSPNDTPPLRYSLAVPNGVPLTVRLYFANRCSCTSAAGSRVFDVSIDGQKRLDNFDIVASVGDQRGTMRAFDVTSDGTLDIETSHEVENPLINGIEVIRRDLAPPAGDTDTLRKAQVTTTGAGAAVEAASALPWASYRGAFVAGSRLYYGDKDGTFNYRTFANGTIGGTETVVDPYNDPDWAGRSTGSGNTYDGNPVQLYSQMASVTGMAFNNGRLFYTLAGDANLYWRWFNADSGVIGSQLFTASSGGRNWSTTAGMFAADGRLYFASRIDGSLNAMPLGANGPTGASTVVDSPLSGGNDWRSRAMFLAPSEQAPPNADPTARFNQSCVDLVCNFDGTTSTDTDGTVESWDWDFGGDGSGSGAVVSHTFSAPGTYQVTLEVTDNRGGTHLRTQPVTVSSTPTTQPISHVASAAASANRIDTSVQVPTSVQAGDVMVLSGAFSNAVSADAPSGWTKVGDQLNSSGLRSAVWWKVATASDAGSTVTTRMEALHKASISLNAYRGVASGDAIASIAFSTDSNTATHTAPAASVPNGAWVVTSWAEKSASTTQHTTTATMRSESYSTGTGRTSIAVADSNGPRSGAVPGETATSDAVSSRGINWTIVLAPRS